MKSTLWGLGLLFSALSVVMLIKQAADVSFASALGVILGFYEDTVQKLFGWAEPAIRSLFEDWRRQFGWELDLRPHWKHVTVLFWLYFGAYVRTRAAGVKRAETGKWVYRGELAVIALAGGLVAVVVGVLCGTLALDDPGTNLLVVVLTLAGAIVFEFAKIATRTVGHSAGLGYAWRPVLEGEFDGSIVPGASFAALGFICLGALSIVVPEVGAVPALALVFLLLVGVALHDLWKAKEGADMTATSEGAFRDLTDEAWSAADRRQTWRTDFLMRARMGLLILSSIGSAFVFLLTTPD